MSCSSIIGNSGNCASYGFTGQNFTINSEVAETTTELWSSINLPGLSGTLVITPTLIADTVDMSLVINGGTPIPLTEGETYSASISPLQSVEITTVGAIGINQISASINAIRLI